MLYPKFAYKLISQLRMETFLLFDDWRNVSLLRTVYYYSLFFQQSAYTSVKFGVISVYQAGQGKPDVHEQEPWNVCKPDL